MRPGGILHSLPLESPPLPDLLTRLREAVARRYVIERELGQGGMGTVYLALDRRHNRRVALKVLPPELAAAIGPERFRREIAIMSRLAHPHILALHDSGQAAGTLFYVMPYVEGESLGDRLRDHPEGLTLEEALSIADEIADALEYAHRLGVVHRDISPDNILLTGGHAFLADFGIARLLEQEGELLTDSGTPLGTALYRSPEQAAGSANLDARTDLYSLGAVLYRTLGGTSAEAHLARRFSDPLPALTTLREGVSAAVAAAVRQAMAAAPDQRFATAVDFRRALTAPPAGPAVPARPKRRLAGRWAAAATVVVLGLAAAAVLLPARGARLEATRVLVTSFENRTADSTLDVLGQMAGDYLARGLAATHLVEVIAPVSGDSSTGAGGSRALARSLGAGTLLLGSYFREGGRLSFEAQVIEAGSGRLRLSVDPVEGPEELRTQLVEVLRQRVMAAFAVLFGPGFEAWEAQSLPPSYAAYQEILAGNAALTGIDFGEARRHYTRAALLDTAYTGARTMAALAAGLDFECRVVDSIAGTLAGLRARLPPIDRGQLDWGSAHCRGDWPAALTAGRAVLSAAPRSLQFALIVSVTALELFRPREALELLRHVDPDNAPLDPMSRGMAWNFQTLAYHQLGEHAEELGVALRARKADPEAGRGEEIIALAALGRAAELRRRIQEWFGRSDLPDSYLSQGQVQLCAALELRTHGYPDEAAALLAEASTWYRSRPALEQHAPIPSSCTVRLFTPLYYEGRWDEARALYRASLARDSTDLIAHEALGALAARAGDRAEVARVERWLATPRTRGRRAIPAGHEPGRSTYVRARMALLLGDREKAAALLRQAFLEGLNHRMFVHVDPDFEALHDHPIYRELLAIKG